MEKEAPEKETSETPDAAPLLDMTDAAVRKMIRLAKKRGYVTYEQLNAVLPSEEVTSEKIEDILAMLNEMGINTIESEEAETDEEDKSEDDDDETEGDLVEVTPKPVATTERRALGAHRRSRAHVSARNGLGRTASREGEIAIAKRIEAGREAMIAGLCESPLTFQAIIIWRDELNDGKVFLRDIIDLEATYAGPDAKNQMGNPAPAEGQAAQGTPLCSRPARRRHRPPRRRSSRPCAMPPMATAPRRRPKARWMTMSSRIRCRWPPSPSSAQGARDLR